MHAPSSADPAACDAERVAIVSAALGAQRFGELVAILGGRLRDLAQAIETSAADAHALVPVLHQSRGSAASLGLVGLASAMSDIETLITADPTYISCRRIGDEVTLAAVKSAAHALIGAWSSASKKLALQKAEFRTDHDSGICIK